MYYNYLTTSAQLCIFYHVHTVLVNLLAVADTGAEPEMISGWIFCICRALLTQYEASRSELTKP